MLAVVALFEKLSGRRFTLEHIPAEVLTAQFEGATDSMQKSFAALMLGSMAGDAMEMGSVVEEFGLKLTSVAEYARVVLGT